MHDRYSLSNKINYSLQLTMNVFELVWISVQQPSYKITVGTGFRHIGPLTPTISNTQPYIFTVPQLTMVGHKLAHDWRQFS